MYCHTNLKYEFRRYDSALDINCQCCNRPIPQGKSMFYIAGERWYEKLYFEPTKHTGPFVPRHVKKGADVDPAAWRDRFTSKTCIGCALRLMYFTRGIRNSQGLEHNISQLQASVLATRFPEGETFCMNLDRYSVRWYGAIKDYNCYLCGSSITSGDTYMRRGHYCTYCSTCTDRIVPLIGNTFSY